MKQKKLPPNPLFYKLPQYHLSSLTIQHLEWCLWTQENVLLLTMTNIILTWFLWQVFNVSEGELSTRIVCIHKEMTKTEQLEFNFMGKFLRSWYWCFKSLTQFNILPVCTTKSYFEHNLKTASISDFIWSNSYQWHESSTKFSHNSSKA